MNNKTKSEEIEALREEGLNDISGGVIVDTNEICDMKGHGRFNDDYEYFIVDDKDGRVIIGLNGNNSKAKRYLQGGNTVIDQDYLANHPIQHCNGKHFDDFFVKGEDGYNYYYKPMMKEKAK